MVCGCQHFGSPVTFSSRHSSLSHCLPPLSLPLLSSLFQSNGKVEVYHTKKQQSHSTKPAEYFGFEWTLKMVLNNDMTSMKVIFYHHHYHHHHHHHHHHHPTITPSPPLLLLFISFSHFPHVVHLLQCISLPTGLLLHQP